MAGGDYQEFLSKKTDLGTGCGFEPIEIPEFLFPFQKFLTEFAIRRGRAAIFADCLGGESVINSPDGDISIEAAFREKKPLRVFAVQDDRVVIARASRPFISGVNRLYRFVFSSGREIVATMGHRFLSPSGWRRGDSLSVGESLLVSDASRLRSNPGSIQPILLGGDPRCCRTPQDCSGRCSAYPCPCGGQLRSWSDTSQGPSPSQADVLGHIRHWSSSDVRASKPGRNHRCLSHDLRPIDRSYCRAETTEGVEGFRLLSSDRAYIGGNSRTSRPTPEGTTLSTLEREPHPSGATRFADDPFLPCDDSPVELDTLSAIHYIRTDVFYDITVPETENYLANNIWSHNCGMGKTGIQLSWADNVVRSTNRPVLILTPLAVGSQTVREAGKFGFDVEQSRDGRFSKKIVVTNYEQLGKFKCSDFSGVVADESSILKNSMGRTKAAVTEFMRTIDYRLLCTATPSPNDFMELGTSAEALGELGYQDMVTRFFRQETTAERKTHHRAWARQLKWVLKGHAKTDFWRWICSWSRACRKPSDLGFSDEGYVLPELIVREHLVEARAKREGFLFDLPAITIDDQREERRRTLKERCEKVAELIDHDEPAIAWCHLNPEGDLLAKLIPDSIQVSGADSDEEKEAALMAFVNGDVRVLVTKPKVAGFGLNFQHCAHQTHFPSYSWEQFHQCKHRSHRFGQKRQVELDIVTTEGEFGVLASLQRKAAQVDVMFSRLVELANNHLVIARENPFTASADIPGWLEYPLSSVEEGCLCG